MERYRKVERVREKERERYRERDRLRERKRETIVTFLFYVLICIINVMRNSHGFE